MKSDTSRTDRRYLERAIELGRRGWGRVHPNPLVGCVLVRDGAIVGEGWHREFGEAHAEVEALREAGERAAGAVAYVSLEPCRHHGRTPPCTRALLAAGVTRVVFGATDPGVDSGGGAEELSAAGVEVEGPLLSEEEARAENRFFFHSDPSRPRVELKLAVSRDGKIAAQPGARTRLSGPEATEEVHRLRAGFDAILVGTGTLLTDDPLLTVRGPISPRIHPVRIALDARGRLGPSARLLSEGDAPVWVLTGPEAPEGWGDALRAAGAEVLIVATDSRGWLRLAEALKLLRRRGIRTVLCEGGGVLGSALLEEALVDRLHEVVVPRDIGPRGVPAYPEVSPGFRDRWEPVVPPRRFGSDLWVELEPVPATEGAFQTSREGS